MPAKFPCSVDVTAINRLVSMLNDAPTWLQEEARETMDEYGPVLRGRAQRRAPVLTGRLRRNISYYVVTFYMDAFARLGLYNPVEYSGFQEFGTGRMAAQPHMRPAIEETTPEIVRDLRNQIVGRINEMV